jgi:hypothetical protein
MVVWGCFGNWENQSHRVSSSSQTPNVLHVTSSPPTMRHTVLGQSSASVGDLVGEEPDTEQDQGQDIGPDAEFGGPEARLNLERKLLRKLDMRMSILVLIYILNYVRLPIPIQLCVSSPFAGRQE